MAYKGNRYIDLQKYPKKKMDRREIFNFKNVECQETFQRITSETNKLNECFKTNQPFEEQAEKWNKTLKSCFHQALRKIRGVENKPKATVLTKLLEERKMHKQKIKLSDYKKSCAQFEREIEKIDLKVAHECSEVNLKKIKENFGTLTNELGGVNNNGMWKIKKKVFPKNGCQLPVAKKNFNGQIITNPETLKQLYLDTYKHRLRHRPIKTGYEEIKSLPVSIET